MLYNYLEQFKTWLHDTVFGQFPFLEYCVFRVLDLITGPVTGVGTRFHWFQLLETFLLATLVYVGGRHVRPAGGWRGLIHYCFPKEIYLHPSARVDYQLAIMNAAFSFVFNITWRINTVLMIALLTSWMTRMFGPAPHALEWTPFLLIGVTALILVVEDLTNYIYHVLLHKVPFLWTIHKVHHSAEVLTPLTGLRTHPLEYAFAGSIRAIGTSFVLAPVAYWFVSPPAPLEIFGIAVTVVIFGALGSHLTHSHVWLSFGPRIDRVIVSPAVHQLHHSQAPEHHDRNFAVLFSVWDWMFGTLCLPQAGQQITYGIHDENRQVHPNFLAAWLIPFWEMVPYRTQIIGFGARLLGPWVHKFAAWLDLIRVDSAAGPPGQPDYRAQSTHDPLSYEPHRPSKG